MDSSTFTCKVVTSFRKMPTKLDSFKRNLVNLTKRIHLLRRTLIKCHGFKHVAKNPYKNDNHFTPFLFLRGMTTKFKRIYVTFNHKTVQVFLIFL